MTSTPSGALELPHELCDREFLGLIQRSAEPVVVESYFAGWERPWRGLTADGWRELRRELDERVSTAVLETGASRGFAERYGLEIIPAVLVFLRGELVTRFSGSVLAEGVVAAVKAALRRGRELESDRTLEAQRLRARVAPAG